MKKYELTDETIEVYGTALHRIKALKDFGNVKKESLEVMLKANAIYLKKVTVGCAAMQRCTAMQRCATMQRCTAMLTI